MNTPKVPRSSLCRKRTARQILSAAFAVSAFITAMISPTYAASLQSSQMYIGFMQFLNDLMTVAMIACPVIGGLAAVVFLARRSMADEQDGKMWMKRVYQAVACGIGGGLVTGIIALITSYVNP